ncbi:hypothetical protein ACET3Z_001249 [Daucus carota]
MLRQDSTAPDKFTYPFVIKSCGGLMSHGLGKQVHGHVFKFGLLGNVVIENSLLNMYLKCDNVGDAHNLFGEMGERDVISWNGLICGHVKLGQMKKAKAVFEEMPIKSVVTWTTMISGYTRIGYYADALDVFRRMQIVGVKPDWISLITVLRACSQLGALELGKWIHFYADRNGFLRKTCICNALIEMYAKCGSINEALLLFDYICERDVISWSTMIMGLSNHGKAGEAIQVFQEMQLAKVVPNEITFVGLLSACAHAGLLDEGLKYFESMRNEYNIEPGIEHYGCLVDLLGRTGCYQRALELVKHMPMKADSAIWGSLLSSCRIHGNLDTAVVAMEHLIELEPDDTGNYVLLSNIYAKLGKWDGVSRMRKIIRHKSLKKTPGCSMIEIDNTVQEFVSAGNRIQSADYFGYAKGTASGFAPKARLAMYKVLFLNNSYDAAASDTMAGMDLAIDDGVNLMSLSLGFFDVPFYRDPIALGAFAAMEKGVFLSCSAGNGPHGYTINNGAPWNF